MSNRLVLFMLLLAGILVAAKGKAYHEPDMEDEVHEFETTYDKRADNLEIKFAKSFESHGQVGICYLEYGKGESVYILRSHWEESTELGKKAVLFHELGHCLLGRDHNDDKYKDGCPKSFMSTYIPSDKCTAEHLHDLIEELRQKQ
jgi:hypothetical protein